MFDVHFFQSVLGKTNLALMGYMGLPLKNSREKWSIGLIERRIREKGNISINPGSFRKNPPQSPFLKGGRYRNTLPY